jgi:hypothetical protein
VTGVESPTVARRLRGKSCCIVPSVPMSAEPMLGPAPWNENSRLAMSAENPANAATRKASTKSRYDTCSSAAHGEVGAVDLQDDDSQR